VPADEVAALDENVDPWIHRITRSLWGKGLTAFLQSRP
jgi:hypothetical protein